MRRRFLEVLGMWSLLLAMGVTVAASPPTVAPGYDAAATSPDLVLDKVVMLLRHGLRSPNQTPEQLAPSASRPWPDWGIGPGELTVHGATLIQYLGAYYRHHYAAAGLLPTMGCPSEGTFAVWADNSTRRIPLSAQVLVEGMFPGCGLRAGFQPQTEPDALFHPVELGTCPLHVGRAEAALLDRVGGDLNQPMRQERAALRDMQSLLKVRHRRVCAGGAIACGIDGFANVIQASPTAFNLEGGLKAATTVGENLLLAYLQGLPEEQVGWGEAADPERLTLLMRPRNRYLDLTRRTPYLAERHGTPLARVIMAALTNGAPSATSEAGRALAGATHFSAVVGRDIHLAVMRGVFGLDWQLPDQPDEHGSGVTLAFERLHDPTTRRQYVRPVVFYQTMVQMRSAQVLDAGHPPGRLVLRFPDCAGDERDGACALERLQARMGDVLAQDCPQ